MGPRVLNPVPKMSNAAMHFSKQQTSVQSAIEYVNSQIQNSCLDETYIVLVTAVTVIAHRASQMQQVYTRKYVEVMVNCLFLSLKAEPTAVYLPYIM